MSLLCESIRLSPPNGGRHTEGDINPGVVSEKTPFGVFFLCVWGFSSQRGAPSTRGTEWLITSQGISSVTYSAHEAF
jgi:hypothetical protein